MAEKYGQFYWTVKTAKSTIRLYADEATVEHGAAVFSRIKDGKRQVNMAFGPGQWEHFYAASVIDGGAVAVEHWDKNEKSFKPAAKSGAAKSSAAKTRGAR